MPGIRNTADKKVRESDSLCWFSMAKETLAQEQKAG